MIDVSRSPSADRPAAADEILRRRLSNQHLAQPTLSAPTQLVAHLGAVQAQDYPAALWAVGQRLSGATFASLERAFDAGQLLRTHVLRPTWHFVAPADIRWLLALTAPRVKAAMAAAYRSFGLDASLLARSNAAIGAALAGGNYLTRAELEPVLRAAGISVSSPAMLAWLAGYAELDAVICSGPRRGKQFTYALLDERAPATRTLHADEALAELTRRYFTGHGPATVSDFNWWSGLTVANIRRGLELCGSSLLRETVDGLTYFFASGAPQPAPSTPLLLPNFDEYTVAYRQRDLFYDPARAWTPDGRDAVPFGNSVVVGGRVAGMWRKTPGKHALNLHVQWFSSDAYRADRGSLTEAAERYGAFLDRRVELVD